MDTSCNEFQWGEWETQQKFACKGSYRHHTDVYQYSEKNRDCIIVSSLILWMWCQKTLALLDRDVNSAWMVMHNLTLFDC